MSGSDWRQMPAPFGLQIGDCFGAISRTGDSRQDRSLFAKAASRLSRYYVIAHRRKFLPHTPWLLARSSTSNRTGSRCHCVNEMDGRNVFLSCMDVAQSAPAWSWIVEGVASVAGGYPPGSREETAAIRQYLAATNPACGSLTAATCLQVFSSLSIKTMNSFSSRVRVAAWVIGALNGSPHAGCLAPRWLNAGDASWAGGRPARFRDPSSGAAWWIASQRFTTSFLLSLRCICRWGNRLYSVGYRQYGVKNACLAHWSRSVTSSTITMIHYSRPAADHWPTFWESFAIEVNNHWQEHLTVSRWIACGSSTVDGQNFGPCSIHPISQFSSITIFSPPR